MWRYLFYRELSELLEDMAPPERRLRARLTGLYWQVGTFLKELEESLEAAQELDFTLLTELWPEVDEETDALLTELTSALEAYLRTAERFLRQLRRIHRRLQREMHEAPPPEGGGPIGPPGE